MHGPQKKVKLFWAKIQNSISRLYVLIMSRTGLRVNPHSIRDMIKTYSQMHRTDKYSQHSSIIWPVWLNG